jgi:PAS domain S-box-containing protein
MSVVHEPGWPQPDGPAEPWLDSWTDLEAEWPVEQATITHLLTVHDRHGRTVYVTPSARELFGVDDEAQLLDHDVMTRVHAEDRGALRRAFCGWSSGRASAVVRFRVGRPDGSWCALEAIGSRDHWAGLPGAVVVTAHTCDWDEPAASRGCSSASRSLSACGCGGLAARSRRTHPR